MRHRDVAAQKKTLRRTRNGWLTITLMAALLCGMPGDNASNISGVADYVTMVFNDAGGDSTAYRCGAARGGGARRVPAWRCGAERRRIIVRGSGYLYLISSMAAARILIARTHIFARAAVGYINKNNISSFLRGNLRGGAWRHFDCARRADIVSYHISYIIAARGGAARAARRARAAHNMFCAALSLRDIFLASTHAASFSIKHIMLWRGWRRNIRRSV